MSTDDRTQIGQSYGVQPGTQLNGMYEIDQKIAAGGMGEVYRGHNIQTGDPVAIKIVLPDFAKDPTILALFRKEASVLNHLAHSAIVRYYVFSIDPGIARPYLAMEFVDGSSLAEVMEQGPMASADAERLIGRVASGLAAAHEAGVVHRDLSPDNIILSGGKVSKAKIIDFGIARSETIGGGTLLGGRFAGKYNFVSPEQLGLFGGEVSGRSDIYSLGLVFAAALRGEALNMSGSQVDVIEKRRTVPNLDGIDTSMVPILEAMLQPDPADRPESMSLIEEWLTPAKPVRAVTDVRHTTPPRTARSLPPIEATVLTTPPTARTVLTTPPNFNANPFADERPFPEQRPRTSAPAPATTGGFRAATDAPRGNPASEKTAPPQEEHWAEEEPYSYVASNPPFDGAGGAGIGDPSSAGVDGDAKRSGRWLLPAVAGLILLAGGGGAGWYAGLFGGSGAGPANAPNTATTSGPAASGTPTPPATQPPATTTTTDTQIRPTADAKKPIVDAATAIDWVRNYDGGPCMFLRTTEASAGALSIEGFGASPKPLEAMGKAFAEANGFEPKIGLRQITPKQCDVADFMRTNDRLGGPAPALDLSSDLIRSGDPLKGEITNLASRSLSIWLIDDQGVIYDLNDHLRRAGDRATFSIKLVPLKSGQAVPQLIFAIMSDAPLDSTNHTEAMLLPAFLKALGRELSEKGKTVGVAAKYFQLGG